MFLSTAGSVLSPLMIMFGSSFKKLFHHLLFWFCERKRLCLFKLISSSASDCISLSPPPSMFSLKSLCISLSFSYCPCFVQQLHSVPFNKIKPNRKHSEEINSGLQCLGHPFGLTASAETQRLQLFYKVTCWVNQDLCAFFLSFATRWKWNWQIVKTKGSAKMRWVCIALYWDHAETVIWPFPNCCLDI